jgi:acylglycerol lipase
MARALTSTPREEIFSGAGGLDIFIRSWRPNTKPRAVVVIVHGLNSHSGHYFWVADQFTAKGFAVYALDLRGRGKSQGERFFVEKFAHYTSDVHSLVKLAKAREPGLPVFMLGHSAGGVIACVYALEHQAELAGLVCEDFAHEVPAPDIALALLKGVSHLAPHAHVMRLENEDFSRDPAVVRSMNEDPLIANENQPAQTIAELVRADERLKKEFPLITLPVLILHGTADKVTKPSGSQHFHARVGSNDKTLKLYEGHFHDLLNDVGKDVVMEDILRWVEARVPASAGRTTGGEF